MERREAKRLKGTIGRGAFSCDACNQPLEPFIFQCSLGHFFCCSFCRDMQPTCRICTGCSRLERSYGMERAVESVLVDCRYADNGCREKTAFDEKERHEKACPHAPCYYCPYSRCGFAGPAGEFLGHLTGAQHNCPSTDFSSGVQFDLLVRPGVHVLRCEWDGQPILVHMEPAARPLGYVVSVVCLSHWRQEGGIGCSVSFSCSTDHYNTSTLDVLRCSVTECAPTPRDYLCFVPKVSDGHEEEDAEVRLRMTILCAMYDSDDSSYTESVVDSEDTSSESEADVTF